MQKIYEIDDKYQEYVMDESKFSGYAETISFPQNEEELRLITRLLKEKGGGITIQGGKTGIVGGAVPEGGHILNVSRMNQVISHETTADGSAFITVEPGINLIDLKNEINRRFKQKPVMWPPEPTETSATIGGIAASGAKGPNAYFYGETGKYIEKVKLLTAAGEIEEVKKDGLLDVILSSEGTLGVITELTLKLLPKPEDIWGIGFFFRAEEGLGSFVEAVKETVKAGTANITAIEYVDRTCMDLIQERKKTMSKLKELPDIDAEFCAMVYFELEGSEEGIEGLAEQLMELAAEAGSDPDEAWAVSGEAETDKLKAFRHAAAETANLFIEEQRREDRRITKLGTDMKPAEETPDEQIKRYRDDAAELGLKCCIFGHIGENHLHVNILPSTYEEYRKGTGLIKKWAEEIRISGGTMVCEHGIGKLKRFMIKNLPVEKMGLLKKVKQELDPEHLWCPGNMLSLKEWNC